MLVEAARTPSAEGVHVLLPRLLAASSMQAVQLLYGGSAGVFAICCEKNIPVPGTPTVARIPFGPAVIFAPLGPMETDAPPLPRLSRIPGRSDRVLRKRKDISWMYY